jgi:hypothetical protein
MSGRWRRALPGVAVFALAFAGCGEDQGVEVLPSPDFEVAPDLVPLTDLRVADAPCQPVPELCNGVDDDCDSLVDGDDPDIEVATFDDANNCGACGQVCTTPRGTAGCRAATCVVIACDPGFSDYNADAADGCESDCVISEGGAELCDERDNDCDGQLDEGWSLSNDPENCGTCGRQCGDAAQGTVLCVEGECDLVGCDPGYVDADGAPENGCEYACSPRSTPEVAEFCNGLDDDCDTRIDEAADLAPPEEDFCGQNGVCGFECDVDADCAAQERCNTGRVCVPVGGAPADQACATDADCRATHPGLACITTVTLTADGPIRRATCVERVHGPVCDADAGYRCVRGPGFQPGNEAGACDQRDNDCDGRTDEDFVDALFSDGAGRQRPRTCGAGEGRCRVEARFQCTADGAGTECPAVALPAGSPDDADCDGEDDDCDGRADEDFQDAWVRVGATEIFAFEASRPGATDALVGLDLNPNDDALAYVETRACSRPGVLPWANVTWAEADTACRSLGARLCTGAEWGLACGGAAAEAFPYGVAYRANACNGGEFDSDPGAPGDQDALRPTGSLATCVRGGVADLSGNLKEWTSDLADGLRPVRGGGYESNIPGGLACDELADLKPEELRSSTLGFRCCR